MGEGKVQIEPGPSVRHVGGRRPPLAPQKRVGMRGLGVETSGSGPSRGTSLPRMLRSGPASGPVSAEMRAASAPSAVLLTIWTARSSTSRMASGTLRMDLRIRYKTLLDD